MTKTNAADTLQGIGQCLATLARHEQAVTGGTFVAEQAAQRLALLAEQAVTGGTTARPRGARARAAWKITTGVLMSLWLLGAFAGGGWMPWPLFILVPWGVGLYIADANRKGLVSEVLRRHG